MATSFEAFLPEVMPNVAGCPEMVAINAVRQACREFCTRTTIWRSTLAAIDSVLGQPTYSIVLASGSEVVLPLHVEYNDIHLSPTTEEKLEDAYPTWRDASNGTPTMYLIETKGTIRLHVPPDSAITGGISVRVALRPTMTADTVEDIVYTDWSERIADGALARLTKMAGKDWSNPQLGIYHETQFWNGILMARATVEHGHVKTSRQVTMQFF